MLVKVWKNLESLSKIQSRKSGHSAPTYTSCRISSKGGKNSKYPRNFLQIPFYGGNCSAVIFIEVFSELRLVAPKTPQLKYLFIRLRNKSLNPLPTKLLRIMWMFPYDCSFLHPQHLIFQFPKSKQTNPIIKIKLVEIGRGGRKLGITKGPLF